MTPEFAPTELVERARKLGFDADEYIARPKPDPFGMPLISTNRGNTVEQLERWLESKGFDVITSLDADESLWTVSVLYKIQGFEMECIYYESSYDYESQFEARLAGVTKAIEYLEGEKK